jgi:glycosyltransferase involved in cell wall biosynthesis
MKILVAPGSDIVGGSEINAVELAAGIRRQGHEVALFSTPGQVTDLASEKGLRVIEAHFPRRMRPSPLAVRELGSVLRSECFDLVHAYEGYSCTEAFYATMRGRARMLGTLYSMTVPPYMPTAFPIVGGTALLRAELSSGRAPHDIYRLDPPVDVRANAPDALEGQRFRRQLGIGASEFVIALVSRLDVRLKLDGLVDAFNAMERLGRAPFRLLVVGDGPARAMLARRAAQVNAGCGREAVTLLGHMADPRPAYRAADVVIGMGTSLLRGMAMAKPCVLVGERGLVDIVQPGTVDPYLRQGFWGVGEGEGGATRLANALTHLLAAPEPVRRDLGEFGRRLVNERFGLERAVGDLEDIYRDVFAWCAPSRQIYADAVTSLARVAAFKLQHRLPSRRRAERRALAPGDPFVT